MRALLERLGRFCARRHWIVIAAWVVLLVGLVLGNNRWGGDYVNDYTVPGSQSEKGTDVIRQEFPEQSTYVGQLVFNGPIAAAQGAIDQAVVNTTGLPHVLSVVSPFATAPPTVSADGTIAYATVDFDISPDTLGADYLAQLDAAVAPARAAGLTVEYGAAAGQIDRGTNDLPSEVVGVVVAFVLLFVMFISLVAALIPLVSAAFSVVAGLSIVGLLAAAFTFPTTGPTLATLLGLGVAIDYGLFQVARHREGLAGGDDLVTAAGRANAHSGMAILVAGTTVIIAMLGLFIAGLPFISALGVSAAIAVAMTMLAALTFIPALLGLAGRSVRSMRREPRAVDGPAGPVHEHSAFARWGRYVSRRPWPWAVAAVVFLLVITIPLLKIDFGQLDPGTDPTSYSDRRAYDLIAEGFGPGANGPLTVVVSIPPGADTTALLTDTAQALQGAGGVQRVTPPQVNPAGNTAILNVIPTTGPREEATNDLVHRIRDSVLPTVPATTYLTGQTAGYDDFTARTVERLPWLIAAVVLLSLLLLTTAFRSLAIGIKAAIMNLLSVGAAYGVVVAVFQWGWGSSWIGLDMKLSIPAYVPMIMFAVVFGLSMDYEVFLMSRVREAYLATHEARRSVALGIGATARVITTAALIMIVVFVSFVADPDPTIKMLAVGMAVSVLLDASVVRLILVPAIMSLLGDRAWWIPRWLDRILPRLDIEGASS